MDDRLKQVLKQLKEKKLRVDSFKPLPPELIKNLEEWFRVELTYTSNAIEGNTLSRQETALVVEKGISVEGKSINELLEAKNHAQAFDFIMTLVGRRRQNITEQDTLEIHRLVLQHIDDTNAGRYRTVAVRIAGSNVTLPNAKKVPDLMDNFTLWLQSENYDNPVKIAADAHFKFVSIHPFVDGNGRVARLLMDLLLMQVGYPPALIRKEDRRAYIDAIQNAQLTGDFAGYFEVIYQAVNRSLDIYLDALVPKDGTTAVPTTVQRGSTSELLRIGELARRTGETVHTLRFWTKERLLEVAGTTKGGYQLYDPSMIGRVKEIRRLQEEQRLTITEIKQRLGV